MAFNFANLASSMKSMVETACSDENKARARNLFQATAKKASETAAKVKQTTDRAAESTAKAITEWTGRETTASEMKKVAAVAGATVAVIGVAACLPGRAPVAALRAVGATPSGNNFGSDFEDKIVGAFAENGRSLCFETPYVDSCGQIYPI